MERATQMNLSTTPPMSMATMQERQKDIDGARYCSIAQRVSESATRLFIFRHLFPAIEIWTFGSGRRCRNRSQSGVMRASERVWSAPGGGGSKRPKR